MRRKVTIHPNHVPMAEDKIEMYPDAKQPLLPHLTLQEAVESGDIKVLQASLNHKDILLNALDGSGMSALHKAAKAGSVEIVKLLISQPKADIDSLSKDGSAALHLAVKHRRRECVELLLSKGASLNIQDGAGKTALHIAARKANKDLVEVLLKHPSANVNIESKDEETPLHAAINSGSYEICEILINAKAKVNKPNIGSQTPLILAAVERHSNVLQLIIDSARVTDVLFNEYLHYKDHEGLTALHLAVVNNQYDNVRLLLKAGAEVNHPRENNYETALHIAAMFEFHEIAGLLLEHGADVHSTTQSKQTALHKAAIFDSKTECVKILLSHGAEINALDDQKMTPLQYAVQKAHLEVIKYLISNGAMTSLADDLGRTVLHMSVQSREMACLDLLAELLPKNVFLDLLSAKDVDEMTTLHYCTQEGKLEMMNRLLELGASASEKDELDRTPIHIAAEYGHPRCIEALFKHSKSEINDDDSEGRTPMLLACQNGHYNCVKALIRFGGDVTAKGRDECNHSALTLAASQGHIEIVDLLLDNGANVGVITKYKDTAMHLACKGNHVRVVSLLLSRSASVAARNVGKETPLDTAIEHRSRESAAAIINSERWEEAMSCEDQAGINPFPRLVAFMPSIAELVLNNCIKREGDPESKDFAVTYNFKYLDPHPTTRAWKRGKAWYANDMAEHGCQNLLSHEVTETNIYDKWNKFGRRSFLLDSFYYVSTVIALSVFILIVPNFTTLYEDAEGCPLIVTEEEVQNETAFNILFQNGTAFRYPMPTGELLVAVTQIQIVISIILGGILTRLVIRLISLRLHMFAQWNFYGTLIMASCLAGAIIDMDHIKLVLCTNGWRSAWLGILLSWALLTRYIVWVPHIGLYVAMFYGVIRGVIKALLAFSIFFLAFACCFYITMRSKTDFSDPILALLSAVNMGIGELGFSERFANGPRGPFYVDSLFLVTIFMVLIPITLMNLLIVVAVGDINSIKSHSTILLKSLRIKTIDEYLRFSLEYYSQKKWHSDFITIHPNKGSSNMVIKLLRWLRRFTQRAVFQRSKGWVYHSRLTPVVETIEVVSDRLEQTETRLVEMQRQIDHQNELLLAIAGKLGARLDKRGEYA